MALRCQVHKPRQVIVVALLTSMFWFALNTVILVSYQLNIPSHELKGNHNFRQENKNDWLGFEKHESVDSNRVKKLSPRGISEVEGEELDTINNEISQILQRQYNHDTQLIENGLIRRVGKESLEKPQLNRNTRKEGRKKTPKLLKQKLVSAVRSIAPDNPRKDTADTNIGVTRIPTHDPDGPGENGNAVVIPAEEKKKEKDGYNKYAFNEYASTKISLARSLPDTRSPG